MPRMSSGQLSTAFVLSIEQFKAEHEVPCSCNWLSDAEHSRAMWFVTQVGWKCLNNQNQQY